MSGDAISMPVIPVDDYCDDICDILNVCGFYLVRGQLIIKFCRQWVHALACALVMAHGKVSIAKPVYAMFAVCHDLGTRQSLTCLSCAMVMAHDK